MELISAELSFNQQVQYSDHGDRSGKLELTRRLDLEIVDNFVYLGANISSNSS